MFLCGEGSWSTLIFELGFLSGFDFGVIEVFWGQDWHAFFLCCMDDEPVFFILQRRKTTLMNRIQNSLGGYLLLIITQVGA